MVFEKDTVIVALNKIRDNIWLGDLSEIQNIAKGILDDEYSSILLDEAERTHQLVLELRKQAQKGTMDSRLWLSDTIEKSFSDNKVSNINYIVGTIIKRIIWVAEEVKGAEEKVPSIVYRQSYKFRVIPRPPKYEVRALLKTRFKLLDEGDLKVLAKKLQVEDYSIETGKYSAILRFFSGNEFIEAVILPHNAEINVVEREQQGGRVEMIADAILSTVAGSNQTL